MRAAGQVRGVADPDGEADHRADQRTDNADHGAVRHHDQAHVAVGRAERAQHAQTAQPSLGKHREAGHRDQADEDQPDDGDREHDEGGADPVGLHRCDRVSSAREGEAGDGGGRGVEEHRHLIRLGELPRGDEREVVEQVLWVLDQPEHAPRTSGGTPGVADVQAEGGRELRGHRDLAGARRKVP